MKYVLVLMVWLGSWSALCAQTAVSGTVTDAETGESLIGAVVRVKDSPIGTLTDEEGRFSLADVQTLPARLLVTYMGYDSLSVEITQAVSELKLKLQPRAVNLKTVEIVEYRVSQKERENPLTVEKLDLIAIKETPAVNFYDGLANLKGVDITAAALGFKIINTRGFNSTQPVRSLQLIDGVDNQAPGLNFALGNMVGSSELDVQSVDIIVGASTALYGPGAFNGVISMTTKSPFLHKGFSLMLKGGERQLFDGAIRYAQAFQNKAERDVFAFKVNFAYMRAYDWEADNATPTEQSDAQVPNGRANAGGYDAINRYGDENRNQQINNFADRRNTRLSPGLGVIFRTGYWEKDLADYNTYSLKANTSLHYKPSEHTELIYGYRFGMGTSVFQGINRISLRNLIFQQHQLELKHKGLMIRAYSTVEDAGDSYDIVRTAGILQRSQKDDRDWSDEYYAYWTRNIDSRIKQMEGYKALPPFTPSTLDQYYAELNRFVASLSDSLAGWHQETRNAVDGKSFLRPGTTEFNKRKQEITSNAASSANGTRFVDYSSLYHLQFDYKLPVNQAEIRLGGNFRLYRPDSRGTIFTDTLTDSVSGKYDRISVWEGGMFAYASKKVWKDKLKITGAVRADLHQNYTTPIASPSVSAVYTIKKEHNIRLGYNYAFRFPTLQDQYLNYNVDGIILRGNLAGMNDIVTIQTLYDFFATGQDSFLKKTVQVPKVKPERVQSVEVGYKGMAFKNLFIDGSIYYSWYRDFIGYQFVSTTPFKDGQVRDFTIYRLSTNAPTTVNTMGASVGISYYFAKYYTLSGNYSWNKLQGDLPDRSQRDPYAPFVPAFNTPEHKFNIGFSGSNIQARLWRWHIKNVGFSFNYRWVDGFYFEGSPQYTGFVNAYGLLDAQINYTYTLNKTKNAFSWMIKAGATNVLNTRYIQVYGGPTIGRLGYVSLQFDWGKK